ncbi:MAG: CinA family nicotinamide mononucleotide deamidase-related protein [Bdellovibrionales bacterium]|nr:CinA family nicotinamide mononucleotide deamidase-related protein [Bdellovibrionales bacterium]
MHKSPFSVSILSVGNEIVDGRVINSNAAWLAQRLREEGFVPTHVLSCRDNLQEISDALQFLVPHATCLIVTGGLGPTTDDLTRDAVAAYANLDLELDPVEQNKLAEYYRSRGRDLTESDLQQVRFPVSAKPIPNPVGTAPGFQLQLPSGSLLLSFPGVPKELKYLWDNEGQKLLLNHLSVRPTKKLATAFHCFGIPESQAGRRVSELSLPKDITVGYRPHFPVLEIRLEADVAQKLLFENAVEIVRARLHEFVFGEENNCYLPHVLHTLLQSQKKTLSVAESCTGGLLGKLITDNPGSSEYFMGGGIVYSNALKQSLLDVQEKNLSEFGAVSKEVCGEMASGARVRFQTETALSITGVAGPEGGSMDKPVGTFFIGLATRDSTVVFQYFLPVDRTNIRIYAAYCAIDVLRRHLLELPFLLKPL